MCRPTVLRLTHATDRPAKPVLTRSGLPVPAVPTSIDPRQDFMLGIKVNAEGTSKAFINATWHEYVDDVRQSHFNQSLTKAQLASMPVSKRRMSTDPPNDDPNVLPAEKMQFPFNDGRHRVLSVTASAVSRYGRVVTNGDDAA